MATLLVPVTGAGRAEAGPVDEAPPASIRVCDIDGNLLEVVAFEEYVRQVLPREYPSNWPMEVLKAGAVAIRSYAWWHVRHPWRDGCDLSNTTRHQKYCPTCTNPPTSRSDRAVRETSWVRFEDASRDDIAYAQYCSGSACRRFPEGAHIDQWEARDRAEAGATWRELIAYYYRAFPPRIEDWRADFDLATERPSPVAFDEADPLRIVGTVAGVAPDDTRARVHLYVSCTYGGVAGTHHIDDAGVIDIDGRASFVLEETDRVRACAEDEVVLTTVLHVNGYPATQTTTVAWRPWRSRSERPVDRIADTDDPIAASIAISRRLFGEARPSDGSTATGTVGGAVAGTLDGGAVATTAVVARDDTFADALAATALAGTAGPILFTPGGPDASLSADVGAELDRILAPGATVHLVGGTAAVSVAVEEELRSRGFEPVRHAGPSRIETALAVADHLAETADADTSTVLVARAYGDGAAAWADAVTAGAYAATQQHPILLTGADQLDPRTAAWIDGNAATAEVVLLGGTAAVPADAEERLAPTASVTRVAGPSRDATAVAVAQELWSRDEAPEVTAAIVVDAYGDDDWPFALAASVVSAHLGAPQVVTHRLVPRNTTGAWLDADPDLPALVVGGPGVVRSRIDDDVAGA